MRLLTMIFLATGFSGLTMAHELPGDEFHLQQLAHQLVSLHHLPALILLLVAIAWACLRPGSNRKRTEKIINP